MYEVGICMKLAYIASWCMYEVGACIECHIFEVPHA